MDMRVCIYYVWMNGWMHESMYAWIFVCAEKLITHPWMHRAQILIVDTYTHSQLNGRTNVWEWANHTYNSEKTLMHSHIHSAWEVDILVCAYTALCVCRRMSVWVRVKCEPIRIYLRILFSIVDFKHFYSSFHCVIVSVNDLLQTLDSYDLCCYISQPAIDSSIHFRWQKTFNRKKCFQ